MSITNGENHWSGFQVGAQRLDLPRPPKEGRAQKRERIPAHLFVFVLQIIFDDTAMLA
jgi:hypothetical protein